jgi:hypothetical protein
MQHRARRDMERDQQLKGRDIAKRNEEFNGEYDDEAGMAQSNLRTMARAVDGLLKTIKSNDNLPEWGQEKIAKAEMMLVSVWDYLQSQKERGIDPKVNESRALAELRQIVAELSSEKLGQYKKAAGAQASAADKAGDTKKADKRFSGIVKATKKQFANDEKKTTEANVKTPQSYNKPRWWDDLPAKERDQFFRSQGNPKSASAPKKNEKGVAEGLNDTQKKIEDTINKLEDRLKHAKSDEQWDRISARIERLQAGLNRSKQGVAEGLSKRDQQDVAAIRAAIARLEAQLNHPNADRDAILQSIAHEKKRLALYGQGVAEGMLPKSSFAGSDKHKLGPAAHAKGKQKGPVKKGQFVGGMEEEKKKGADGKACWKGYRYAGTENGKDKCVPVGEDVENIMGALIENLIRK